MGDRLQRYYAHVRRSYRNNTGAGPPDTVGNGTCVFRTHDPTDPTTYVLPPRIFSYIFRTEHCRNMIGGTG
jgi:hypothetical protein